MERMMNLLVRRMVEADAAAYQALRLYALQESPTAFGSSYEEECGLSVDVFAGLLRPDSGRILVGLFDGEQLVGMVGTGRENTRKAAHMGFIRSMYVAPAARGKGGGRQLLETAIELAQTMPGLRQLMLSVTAGNAAAVALYETMGFVSYGVAPQTMQFEGAYYDEIYMVRRFISD